MKKGITQEKDVLPKFNISSGVLGVTIVQSAAAVEYTEYISSEGVRLPNVCPGLWH